MDLRQQAKNVAKAGRYGDSMLLHVNPVEMKGLRQSLPITKNPKTGQDEAFLPFLAPLMGSLLGSSLASAGLLGGLGTLAGGALGSGLVTYAQTGDLKKGIGNSFLSVSGVLINPGDVTETLTPYFLKSK